MPRDFSGLSVPPPGQSLSVIFVSFEEKESSISLGNSTDEMEGAGIIPTGEAGLEVASAGLEVVWDLASLERMYSRFL